MEGRIRNHISTHTGDRRWTSALALTAFLAIVAIGSSGCGEKEQQADTAEQALPVTVHAPYREDAIRVISANGSLAADKQVTVISPVSGRIVSKRVDLGSRVAANQVLFVVDYSSLDAAVQQAQAAVSSAEQQAANLATEFARVQRLYAEGGASQSQFDAIRTQKAAADEGVKQARAMLQQAVIRRNDAEVRAPFSGLVGKVFVEVGDMVGPGVPLAVVTEPAPLIAKIQVPERDFGTLRIGQSATVQVASYPNEAFSGTIRQISPILDAMTRMADVEILLPNRDQRLKAGMYARVEIEADRRPNALMVPSNAVLQEASLVAGSTVSNITRTYYLFVAEGERAVRRNVTLGYTTGDRVEITSGIRPDDKIIVQGHSFLQNGQRVSPASE